MRSDLPLSVANTVHNLSVDPFVRLYTIQLKNNTIFRLSRFGVLTWQGNVYEDVPCSMTEIGQSADGKVNRPKFTTVNPAGMFSASVYQGLVDNAAVTRIRILKSDFTAGLNFSVQESFRVSRIMSLNNTMMVLELRDVLDGHNFDVPARTYSSPEFPHVRLS